MSVSPLSLARTTRFDGGLSAVASEAQAAVIMQPGVNTVIWRRSLSPALLMGLEQLTLRTSFASHVDVVAGELDALVALTAFVPRGELADVLAADIVRLGTLLFAMTGASRACASLVTVGDDKCRKFHADYKALRLVCSYVGPGTECVPESGLVREALGSPLEDMGEANRQIVPDTRCVARAETSDVVLLKGEAFPGNAGYGAVHRSPPILATGGRRLVLKLDTDDIVRADVN
jgi:hypothetical protein